MQLKIPLLYTITWAVYLADDLVFRNAQGEEGEHLHASFVQWSRLIAWTPSRFHYLILQPKTNFCWTNDDSRIFPWSALKILSRENYLVPLH